MSGVGDTQDLELEPVLQGWSRFSLKEGEAHVSPWFKITCSVTALQTVKPCGQETVRGSESMALGVRAGGVGEAACNWGSLDLSRCLSWASGWGSQSPFLGVGAKKETVLEVGKDFQLG